MIHQPQKNLLLVVNAVHQAKHRVVAKLQVLLLVPPVVNQAPQPVLLVQVLLANLVHLVLVQVHLLVVVHLAQVQAHLLAVVLLAQIAANQALQVHQAAHLVTVNPPAVPVHQVALQVPLVVNQVHLLAVRPLAVLLQVVRPGSPRGATPMTPIMGFTGSSMCHAEPSSRSQS